MTATSEHNVTFTSNDREVHGYLQVPRSGNGPGVIVIQEWWGLTSHIADIVRRLADAGFVSLAPDLYGGRVTHDVAEAAEMMTQLPLETAVEDLSGAVDFLLQHDSVTSSTVGAVGFCMGGGFVLKLAASSGTKISAAVPFYGLPSGEVDYSGMAAAVQGHFGLEDQSIPVTAVEEAMQITAEQSGKTPAVFFYPAGHAFLNHENLLGTFDQDQADLAWDRATGFLARNVR